MLVEWEWFNVDICEILDDQIDVWGIKVFNVEFKYVDFDDCMICVIVKQVEVEWLCCVKVIDVEGEFQVVEKFLEVGQIFFLMCEVMQLCYLIILQIIVSDCSNIIVFFLLIDLLLMGKIRE